VSSTAPLLITSKANAGFQAYKKLAHENQSARQQARVWLEGDHLCRAAMERGFVAEAVVASQAGLTQLPQFGLKRPALAKLIVLSDALWADISQLKSNAQFAFILALPQAPDLRPDHATVVLDRIQDPGNMGSILRSASAFGFKQILALKGSVALWSPKVLRAAMGAHFGLSLFEGLDETVVEQLAVPRYVTSLNGGHDLGTTPQGQPRSPVAWVFGNEGQGVSAYLIRNAQRLIRLSQPGGEESLNVAAAAAICLHATAMDWPPQL
jgi:TrmH family RNA methyltransferase